MRNRLSGRIAAAGAAAALALGAGAAWAHHSTAMFEWGKETKLTGTVERFDWTNPHTFLYMSVPGANGAAQHYVLEGMSPNHLSRHGWSKRSLAPGEKITFGYYPLKDKSKQGGFVVNVDKPNGEHLEQLPKAMP